MTPTPVTRVDLHCHSTASQQSRLGIQRALGLPECATPPEEVYELAKRRGMDFVTLTDHDTIDGALELAHLPDAFVSVELTASFKGEPQQVHVLCFGIDADDHDWLQAHADDVEECAEYLHGNQIACALAHPFYAVAAPLAATHRRRLARLFPLWETRNGARAPELNAPALTYIDTYGGAGVGGSDDHAGVDVGRTWTETPPAATPQELLRRIRRGETTAAGAQGSAAKWAHTAIALAARSLADEGDATAPDPRAVLSMVQRVVWEGGARGGAAGDRLDAADARALLRAWLAALELGLDERELIERMQADDFSHAALARQARRAHERTLRRAAEQVATATVSSRGYVLAAREVFAALVPAIPYAPAATFLAREKRRLTTADAGPCRVALVADGIGGTHGVTRTLEQIRASELDGCEVEVIGTDANVDRRLPAVAEVEIPFYRGLTLGVPSLPTMVETLAEGGYDLVHLCSPGPAGVAAALIARTMELPLVGSYHTELGTYAGLRSGEAWLQASMDVALTALYGQCRIVLSPSESADESLAGLGIPAERVRRWERGVDGTRFGPERRDQGLLPGEVTVLYAGRLAREKGVELLADAFLAARARDPRLHLVLAGDGPERPALRARLGVHATFLGWLDADALPAAYASADLFLFASRTDTFGQVVLEAQASGLPVIAVDEGGPRSLIEDRRSGRLCPADAGTLADALCELAGDAALRQRLSDTALTAVRRRTWAHALDQLAGAYRDALAPPAAAAVRAEAA